MSSALKLGKAFVYNNYTKGLPTLADFKLVDELLNTLNEGDYLVEAKYIRVAPCMSMISSEIKLNTTPEAIQLAKIIESKNKDFVVGKYVIGNFGWRTHTIVHASVHKASKLQPYLLPDVGNWPTSVALGVLGTPGNAAYFGFLEICKPKQGDVVVISSAAGAVGSCVGQIAKIKGCKVIGITSSEEKCSWLNECGFDHCINYKKDNVKIKLEEYAPEGIDCYFDNVGGDISSIVIYQMKTYGRVCICGASAMYYNEDVKAAEVQSPLKVKMAKMEGIDVNRWADSWLTGINQNLQWLQDGKLKYKETIIEKFDSIPTTFINTLAGKYFGSVTIQV